MQEFYCAEEKKPSVSIFSYVLCSENDLENLASALTDFCTDLDK